MTDDYLIRCWSLSLYLTRSVRAFQEKHDMLRYTSSFYIDASHWMLLRLSWHVKKNRKTHQLPQIIKIPPIRKAWLINLLRTLIILDICFALVFQIIFSFIHTSKSPQRFHNKYKDTRCLAWAKCAHSNRSAVI